MNQEQIEEDTMGVEQIPVQANQARFTSIPREGVYRRDVGISWWE